jgi:hypothetical protein
MEIGGGEVYTFGRGRHRVLGRGDTANLSAPQLVPGLPPIVYVCVPHTIFLSVFGVSAFFHVYSSSFEQLLLLFDGVVL